MTSVAAVDLGATSGRVVVGEVGPNALTHRVVRRFANDPVRLPDGLHWNLLGLYGEVLRGLHEAARETELASIGIDSWAVDYGLLRDGRLLGEPFHYRDERSADGVRRVHARVDAAELYRLNGLQHLPFNTVFQLAADDLAPADRLLLVPDLLAWWLTGRAVAERTNASTTGLLDPATGDWSTELLRRLDLPVALLPELVDPGTDLGPLRAPLRSELGTDARVMAVGSHDTASAVVGVPSEGPDFAYISCGTWGLVGVELDAPVLSEESRLAGFTNESGVDGRVRYLHNVMGLWLLTQSVREWEAAGSTIDLPALLEAASAVTAPVAVFDPDDAGFLGPGRMATRIAEHCAAHGLPVPASQAEFARSIVESLAEAFARTVRRAAELSGVDVRVVHLVGGGSQNALLCQSTADRLGLPVLAGPVEATALGNLLVQGRAMGALTGDLDVLRALVRRTHAPREFAPRQPSR